MRQHLQRVAERHGEAPDGKVFRRSEHELPAGVMVVAGGAFGEGDAADKAAARHREGEEFGPDDTQPGGRTPPPPAGIDLGGSAQTDNRLGRAGKFAQKLLFEWVHAG